jgi:hypothetical protein
MKKILVQHRESRRKEIFFAENMPITVGCSAECTVSIDEGLSDEVAARIEALENGGYRVVNLSSGGEMQVNGLRVEGASEFREGDAINLGKIEVFLERIGVDSRNATPAHDAVDQAAAAGPAQEAQATSRDEPGPKKISGSKSAVKRAVGLLRRLPAFVQQGRSDETDADDLSPAVDREEEEQSVESKAPAKNESRQKYEPGSFWSRGVQHKNDEVVTAEKGESENAQGRRMPDFQRRRIFPERQTAKDFAQQFKPAMSLEEGGMDAVPEGDTSGRELSVENVSTGVSVDAAASLDLEEVEKLLEQKVALIEEITLLESQQVQLRDNRRALEKEVTRERARLALIEEKVMKSEAEFARLEGLLAAQKGESGPER